MNTEPVGYRHGQAGDMIVYVDEHGQHERIWNSRDGLVPDLIRSRRDNRVWAMAVRSEPDPDHVPQPGDWVIVDMTKKLAREMAMRHAEYEWNDPQLGLIARRHFHTMGGLARALTTDYVRHPEHPVLVQVGPDGWDPENNTASA